MSDRKSRAVLGALVAAWFALLPAVALADTCAERAAAIRAGTITSIDDPDCSKGGVIGAIVNWGVATATGTAVVTTILGGMGVPGLGQVMGGSGGTLVPGPGPGGSSTGFAGGPPPGFPTETAIISGPEATNILTQSGILRPDGTLAPGWENKPLNIPRAEPAGESYPVDPVTMKPTGPIDPATGKPIPDWTQTSHVTGISGVAIDNNGNPVIVVNQTTTDWQSTGAGPGGTTAPPPTTVAPPPTTGAPPPTTVAPPSTTVAPPPTTVAPPPTTVAPPPTTVAPPPTTVAPPPTTVAPPPTTVAPPPTTVTPPPTTVTPPPTTVAPPPTTVAPPGTPPGTPPAAAPASHPHISPGEAIDNIRRTYGHLIPDDREGLLQPGNLRYLRGQEFEDAWREAGGDPAEGGINGFNSGGDIVINLDAGGKTGRTVQHELVHSVQNPVFEDVLGNKLMEAGTEYHTRKFADPKGIDPNTSQYNVDGRVEVIREMAKVAGDGRVGRAFFGEGREGIDALRAEVDRVKGEGTFDEVVRRAEQGDFLGARSQLRF